MFIFYLKLFLDFIAVIVGVVMIAVMGVSAYKEKRTSIAIGQWGMTVWLIFAEVLFIQYGVSMLAKLK